MAYDRLKLADLKNLVKERFFRKNLERDARQIKFNKNAQTYRDLLSEIDRQPLLNNRQFRERQQAQQAQQERQRLFRENIEWKKREQEKRQLIGKQVRIEYLVRRLASDPIHTFNQLESLNYTFTENDLTRLLSNIRGKYFVHITLEDNRELDITLTRANVNVLKSIFLNRVIGRSVVQGSDTLEEYDGLVVTNISLSEFKPFDKNHNNRKNSGFFPYKNRTAIDLRKFQIYQEAGGEARDKEEIKEENECCLIHALRMNNVDESLLKNLTGVLGVLQTSVPLSKMEITAQTIKKKITIHYEDPKSQRVRKGNKRSHQYGREFEEEINLAQFKNHFFVLEDTIYTNFYIKHFEEINQYCIDNPTFKLINQKHLLTTKKGKYYYSENPVTMNSLELVIAMMKAGLFTDYHVDLTKYASDNYSIEPALTNVEGNQKEFIKKIEEEESEGSEEEPIYLFGDCESDVNGKKHEMIAFGVEDMEGKYDHVVYPSKNSMEETDDQCSNRFACLIKELIIKKIEDKKFVKGVLGSRKQNKSIIMFFHNMKYDSILFGDLFMSTYECIKDGQFYSKTFTICNGIEVELRDSLKHFGGKLKDATETFNLDVTKGEAINYKYHTKQNISSHELVSSKIYMNHLKESDQVIFKQNVLTNKFNATEYYLEYLKQDVSVLRKAMLKYRELIFEITGLDAFHYLTISSIGHAYAIKQGCYDGLFEVNGCLREFIQNSVKGGRVFVNPEYSKTEIDEAIEDFDGVSLYPSSMKRLCEDYGLPKGTIKKGVDQTYQYYESKDWYIVKILLAKINKKIQVPCVSVNDGESLKYINHVDEPIELYVDRITLNDYINFQDIEFEIIEGIYWDEGFNKQIGAVIEKLHSDRCKYKKSNVPLATMIKLIMNSIYGKTGIRKSETKTTFVSHSKKDEYIYNHFGVISEIHTNQFNTKIVKRNCDQSGNLNYVASSILSMSKRIMNEVFSVMDDLKQPVFYTDTDSIHMLQKDVCLLGETYNEKFKRDLIGKQLGQFHTDFEMKDVKCTNVHSIKHIPICTKTYLDVLKGTDSKGNLNYDVHIRIKGITKAGIDFELARRGMCKIESAISLFRDLKDNKPVTFYLNPTEHDVSFEFTAGTVSTRKTQSFIRILNDPK
jgi:hypothetical protein